jgi:sulfur relay protein TusB/DsrH
MFGLANKAREDGGEVNIYLLGDGVYNAKSGLKEGTVKAVLEKGAKVRASGPDIKARALSGRVEEGVEILDDFENEFVKEMMENSERVISW